MPDAPSLFDTGVDPPSPAEVLEIKVFAVRLVLAIVLGFVVAGVYWACLGRRRRSDARTLATTLALLTVLLAVVTMVIGNSIARAFGLVGALSIVRFRTVVEDTRDTAFVIFAVTVGMAAGAGKEYTILAAAAIPAIALVAGVMALFDRIPRAAAGSPPPTKLTVRIALGHEPDALLGPTLSRYLTEVELVATETAKQGAAIELNYTARFVPSTGGAVALLNELNKLKGVQHVEIK